MKFLKIKIPRSVFIRFSVFKHAKAVFWPRKGHFFNLKCGIGTFSLLNYWPIKNATVRLGVPVTLSLKPRGNGDDYVNFYEALLFITYTNWDVLSCHKDPFDFPRIFFYDYRE